MATCNNAEEEVPMETKVQQLMEGIVCIACHAPIAEEARTLPCLHRCCSSCLQTRATKDSATITLDCYKCSKTQQFSREDVLGLPLRKNTSEMQELLAAIKNKKRRGSLLPCELCTHPEPTPGMSYCYDCGKTLCSYCEEAHVRLRSFAHHTMVPARKMTLPAPPTKPRPPRRTKRFCTLHSKDVEFYCLDCELLICSSCLLENHGSHEWVDISEANELARRRLGETKQDLVQLDSDLDKTRKTLEANIEKVEKEGRETRDFINQSFNLVLQPFEKYRQNLLRSLENRVDTQLGELREKESSVFTAKKQLQEIFDQIDRKLSSNATKETFLKENKSMLQKAKEKEELCKSKIDSASNHGHTFDSFVVYQTSSARIIGAIGDSLKSADPIMCTLSGDGAKQAEIGKEARFVLEAQQSNDAPCQALQYVQAELCSLADGAKYNLAVQLVKGSQYAISYTPKTQGQHLLTVRVNGKPILGNPFQVAVKRPILKRKKPILMIEGMKKISDVAVHRDGSLLVTQTNEGAVIKVDKGGQYMQTLFSGLNKPYGIATNASGAVYVSLNSKCCVLKYDKNRHLLQTTGCKDSTLGHFNHPGRMALNQRGDLMICDVKNSRIQVFDEDLDYLKWYSISQPVGVSSGPDGKIYVSENGRDSLCEIRDASRMGILRLNEELSDPQGVSVDDDYVLGLLKEPGAVTGDKDGYLYVCDEALESIVVF